MARDEDRIAIRGREHAAGIEAHAERAGMRADQRDRRLEFAALSSPTELVVWHVALVAKRVAEMLPGLGHPVELVVGDVLGQPITPVVGEIKLLGRGMEIEA